MMHTSSIAKCSGAFAIQDEMFVKVDECVYKLTDEAMRHVDLDLLSGMTSNYRSIVDFTFDRRFLTSGVDKIVLKPI